MEDPIFRPHWSSYPSREVILPNVITLCLLRIAMIRIIISVDTSARLQRVFQFWRFRLLKNSENEIISSWHQRLSNVYNK